MRLFSLLLREHFGNGVVRFGTITPKHVWRFFGEQAQHYKGPPDSIFARHVTPRERPIGPDLVRKTNGRDTTERNTVIKCHDG